MGEFRRGREFQVREFAREESDYEKEFERGGFCREEMEVGKLERMWRDEGDEENEKTKKKWWVTVGDKWRGENASSG